MNVGKMGGHGRRLGVRPDPRHSPADLRIRRARRSYASPIDDARCTHDLGGRDSQMLRSDDNKLTALYPSHCYQQTWRRLLVRAYAFRFSALVS